MTRKLELRVEVQELNETGEYIPVEVQPNSEVGTGGTPFMRYLKKHRDENRAQTV